MDCSNATSRFFSTPPKKYLKNIAGLVETFTSLERLNLSKNDQLNNPDLLTGAVYNLVSLDVSECQSLSTLNLMTSVPDENADNKLKLQYLNCSATPLTELNLAKCPELVSLDCSKTKLSTINLSMNTKLRSLLMDNMGYGGSSYTSGTSPTLTTLNVTPCTELRELSLAWGYTAAATNNRNPLSALDVSKCTKLEILNCKGSKLEALTLSSNTALKDLNCSYNPLTELDVSECTALEKLDCSVMYNGVQGSAKTLKTLTFGDNKELYRVFCQDSGLTQIDISTCPKLTVDKSASGFGLHCDDSVIVVSSPKFHSNALMLRGNLGLLFNIEWPAKDMDNYFQSNTSMSFDINGLENRYIFDGQFATNPGDKNATNSNDIFGYECPVNSVQIADPITAYFAYTKQNVSGTEGAGETTIISKDYTVQVYLKAMEESRQVELQQEELHKLVKAIKDFGHYVQPVLAKRNSWEIGTKHALIEAGNTYSNEDIAKAADAVKTCKMTSADSGSGLTIGYTLQLDSMTTLIIDLYPGDGVTTVSAKVDGGTAEMAINRGEYYDIEISDISPHMLSKDHTVNVTTNKGSLNINISALSYADAILNPASGTTPNLGYGITTDEAKNAAASLYYYCDYTRKYRAKQGYED